MNKLIVISGCSGSGKSTLISALNDAGYSVVPEAGRIIVKEQLQFNGNVTPWENPRAFCELLIERSVTAFQHAQTLPDAFHGVIFFDRSFLEGVSYYHTLKDSDDKYDHLVGELRYFPTIFMTPPWKEIYLQDDERKHSFADAVAEYDRLLEFYPQHGYQIIELPKVSVNDRVEFLLSRALSP